MMNRFVIPAITVVAVAATVVVSATSWPPAEPPAEAPSQTSTRVTVSCPSFDSATAQVRVAVAGEGVRTTTVSEPGQLAPADQVAVLSGKPEPVLVSGDRAEAFGAVSLASATAGPDRGLSAATCEGAVAQRWFAGVEVGEDAQADLVLVNPDSTDATVDVTIFGPDGVINSPGSRGIVVAAHSTRSVPLSVLANVAGAVTLRVESSAGRTAATVRQRLWNGTSPRGADWVPSAVPPASDLVVPGIASGPGERRLVVTNPGERTASVAVEVLGDAGRGALAGVENLEVPAASTRDFDLGSGLGAAAAGLHLTSTQPVLAAVRQTSDPGAAAQDPAWAAAQAPVAADGLWPLVLPSKTAATVLLSNPGEQDAKLSVAFGDHAIPTQPAELTVPAGSTLQVPVPQGKNPVIRVQAGPYPVYGAVVVTGTLGKVHGLAVVPLLSSASATTQVPPVRFDPHTGS